MQCSTTEPQEHFLGVISCCRINNNVIFCNKNNGNYGKYIIIIKRAIIAIIIVQKKSIVINCHLQKNYGHFATTMQLHESYEFTNALLKTIKLYMVQNDAYVHSYFNTCKTKTRTLLKHLESVRFFFSFFERSLLCQGYIYLFKNTVILRNIIK